MLKVEPLTSFATFSADTLIGTIWPSLPWMIRVGFVDRLQIPGIVDLRELMDAIVLALDAASEPLEAEALAETLVDRYAIAVEAIERDRQVIVELRVVGRYANPDGVEDLDRSAFRVGGSLQHQRRNRADEDHLGDLKTQAEHIPACVTDALGLSEREIKDLRRTLSLVQKRLEPSAQKHLVVSSK
jgi:hypothetical protein